MGRESDTETGLYFYRARYYDPTIGRFLSEDPIGGEDGKQNFYTYASNDPVDRFDPTGLSDLLYLGGSQVLVILNGNGQVVGIYPAANNVCSGCKGSAGGPYPEGTYNSGPYHPHPENSDPNGSYGLRGIFLFPRPGCPGCGVHAGRQNVANRAGQVGPQHPTLGCIRTTDDAIQKIIELTNAGDPVKHLHVR